MQQNTSVDELLPLIFIAGNSHSGSTLLGYLLASQPDIIYLGELKSRTWLQHQSCSCGQSLDECTFYSRIENELNQHKKRSTDLLRQAYSQKWVGIQKNQKDTDICEHLTTYYTLLSRQVRTLYPTAKWIVDSSKSVYMLRAWQHILPAHQIKILVIRRPLKSNIASFVKRGSPFLKNLIGLMANRWMLTQYLKNSKTQHHTVRYDRFHGYLEDELQQISAFLNIQIPTHYKDHHNHHVIAGNQNTRKSFSAEYNGIHADDAWKTILRPWQKWLAGKFN